MAIEQSCEDLSVAELNHFPDVGKKVSPADIACSVYDIWPGMTDDDRSAVSVLLHEAVQTLDPRERRIFYLREVCERTWDEIGDTLPKAGGGRGISRERVRQIHIKLMRRLRHPSRSLPIKLFLKQLMPCCPNYSQQKTPGGMQCANCHKFHHTVPKKKQRITFRMIAQTVEKDYGTLPLPYRMALLRRRIALVRDDPNTEISVNIMLVRELLRYFNPPAGKMVNRK